MSSREDDLEELANEPERSDERTMFDADMMARLNALDDDDDGPDEAIDEADRKTGELPDIGALVEPLHDNPELAGKTNPFDETNNEMPAADDELDDDELDDDRTDELPSSEDDGKTVANFNLADFEALRAASPEDDEGLLATEPTDAADEPSIDDATRPGYGEDVPYEAGPQADLWDDASDQEERGLGTSDGRSGEPVEATAAMVLQPLPETGEVNLAELDGAPNEDHTDRNTMPEVASLVSTGTSPTIELGERALCIGRASSCDVHIQDATMSRQHCNVWMRDGQVWVEDQGSGNGTWIDGERISEATVLRPGQHLLLGQNIEFVLTMPNAQEEAADEAGVAPYEAMTSLAPAVNEPLMGFSGQMSTTYAHGDLNNWQSRLRSLLPLAAASIVFIVGASVFFVRQGRAQARQQHYNRATALFVDGISSMQSGDFEKSSKTFDEAGQIDPKHPRLPLYRKATNALRMQASILDEAEKAIADGRLQEATASLIALRPNPQLEARARTLNARLESARLADQLAALEAAIEGDDKAKAEQLLTELRAAGLDTSKLELFEARLGSSRRGSRNEAPARAASDGGTSRANPNGPLKRVHLALRQGNVEKAFTINRELAASGVGAATKLEDSGNLAELRELVRMAKEAVAVRDHAKVLSHTKRGLRLVTNISAGATGTRHLLQQQRADGYYFQAASQAASERLCAVHRSLMQVKKLNPKHPKLSGALAKVEQAAAQNLAWAKNKIANGDKATAKETLKRVMCMTGAKSPVHREAKALLR